MFDQFTNRLTISGILVARTALRVGTGRSAEPIGAELPVLRDARDRPLIPGASLKGVFRSYIESLIRAVTDDRRGACIPTGEDADLCLDRNDVARLKKEAKSDKELAHTIWASSCLVCRTFGSSWLASHVWVSDLPVDKDTWFGQFQVRDGVAVDRDTGTVGEGLLYNYEVVPAGTSFRCEIAAEGLEDWQLGMLWLGLQPFLRGEMAVGGFRSRGLGTVKLEELAAHYFDLGPEGNRAARLIDYVVSDLPGDSVSPEKARGWVKAFKAKIAGLTQQEE
jgi:CRISPR-associated RAMP protein (TIGR02581 family)